MFYHQSILQRRGQFGIIWLAATDISKIKRRDIASVNLYRTCKNIQDYILVRVHPRHGGSRPRFSLYLSAQLLYGVVRIFKNQSQYLLEESSSFFIKVHRATINEPADIDLKDVCKPVAVTVPDLAELSSANLIGYDPFFGRLQDQDEFSELGSDLFPWYGDKSSADKEFSSPEVKKSSSRSSRSSMSISNEPVQLKSVMGSPHTVASIEEITLKEPSFTLPQLEMQEDLLMPESSKLGMIEEDIPLDLAKHLTSVNIPLDLEEQFTAEQRDILSPKEKTPAPSISEVELPRVLRPRHPPTSPGVTPAPDQHENTRRNRRQAALVLELGPATPSPSRKRRRRHLAVDQDMQLTKKQMRENMSDTSDIVRNFPDEMPDVKFRSVEDLWRNPGRLILKRCFGGIWSNQQYELRITDSDTELPCWTVPDLQDHEKEHPRKRRRQLELSEPEIPVIPPPEAEITIPDQPQPEAEITIPDQQDVSVVPEEQPSIERARDASSRSRLDLSRGQDLSFVSTPSRSILSDHDKSEDSSIQKESTKRKSGSSRKSKGMRSRGSIHGSSEEEVDLLPRRQSDISAPPPQDLSTLIEEPDSQIHPSIHLQFESDVNKYDEQNFIGKVEELTCERMSTTFHEICPTGVYNKKEAAGFFSALLAYCAAGIMEVRQDRSYGAIQIKRGPNW